MKGLVLLLALVPACTEGGGPSRAGDVSIEGFDLRIAPVAATSAAGYGELHHHGSVPDTLISVSTDAGDLSLHRSVLENGLQTMHPVASWEIPADRTTRLAPGGLHLMLEHFRRPLEVGDTVRITLRLARGGTVTVAVPVRPVGGDD